MTTQTPNLMKALLGAQRSINGVGRDSENKFDRYWYTSSETMMRVGREAFHANDLLFIDAGGKFIDETTARWAFELTHAESGETMRIEHDIPVVERKGMPRDKAMFAASTMAMNYAIRGLLALPRVDASEEPNAKNDGDHEPTAKRRAAPDPTGPRPAGDPIEGEEISPGLYRITTRVVEVTQKTQTKGKKETPYWVARFECGWSGSTWKPEQGDLLNECADANKPLVVEYERKGAYRNISTVYSAPREEKSVAIEARVEAVEHHKAGKAEWWTVKTSMFDEPLIVTAKGIAETLSACVGAAAPSEMTYTMNKKGKMEIVNVNIARLAEGAST